MGTGPGHVARAIEAAFAAEPGSAFSVDELCRRVYRGADRVEKKHRVAVLRAAKANPRLIYLPSYLSGGTLIFFELGSVKGYGLARLKATNYSGKSDAELRGRLRKGGVCHELVAPGGDWYRQVEMLQGA
jgi:hypothetical protein